MGQLVEMVLLLLFQGICNVASFSESWRYGSPEYLTYDTTGEPEYEDRVIGGVYTDITEFPSMVFLTIMRIDSTGRTEPWACGGTIISEYWVLTACHCVAMNGSMAFKEAQLRAGSSLRDSGGVVRNAYIAIMHERYDHNGLLNDVALLKVSSPFPIDGVNIRPANLAAVGQIIPIGTQATIVGWGRMTMEVDNSPYLLKAEMEVVPCMASSQICTQANKADEMFGSTGVCIDHESYETLVQIILNKTTVKLNI